jgi:hypothetical protein
MGFGGKVERALQERRQQLIAHGFAKQRADGSVSYQADLLATLQRRELDRVGERLALKRTERSQARPACSCGGVALTCQVTGDIIL